MSFQLHRRLAKVVVDTTSTSLRPRGMPITSVRWTAATTNGKATTSIASRRGMATVTMPKPESPLPWTGGGDKRNPFLKGGGKNTSSSKNQHNGSSSRSNSSNSSRRLAQQLGWGSVVMVVAQYQLGSTTDFFEHKFVTSQHPEDLADFYGTEDFVEVFCCVPFMISLMMGSAKYDDKDGTIHSWGLLGPGALEVAASFDQRRHTTTTTKQQQPGTAIGDDGEPDTLSWFNKRETFQDVAPASLGGGTLWKMTQNFGYHRRDDGTCEIYHHGESFQGIFPMRILFQLHAKYVIWATERYINSEAFRIASAQKKKSQHPFHASSLLPTTIATTTTPVLDDDDPPPPPPRMATSSSSSSSSSSALSHDHPYSYQHPLNLPDATTHKERRHSIPENVFQEFVHGLSREVEKSKKELAFYDTVRRQELNTTLRRLDSVLVKIHDDEVRGLPLPRLHTLRRSKPLLPQPLPVPIMQQRRRKRGLLSPQPSSYNYYEPQQPHHHHHHHNDPSIEPNNETLQQEEDELSELHLVVEDEETKNALETAIQQLSASKGHRQEVISEIIRLARRTSMRRFPVVHSQQQQQQQHHHHLS
jgi:hypothetical protein